MDKTVSGEGSLCGCIAVRRAARAVTQLYDLCLAPTGLKATQFIILQAIAEHGEVSQSQIAREIGALLETLSRRLAKIRNAGWVTMRIGGKHQHRLYSLTADGAMRFAQAQPFWQRAEERLADALEITSKRNLLEAAQMVEALTGAAQKGAELRAANGAAKAAQIS